MRNTANGMNLEASVKSIFTLAEKAVPYTYRDRNGDLLVEEVGDYRTDITKDMVDDMYMLSLLIGASRPELRELLKDVAKVMKIKDLNLRRMQDDMKAGRELSIYAHDDTEDAIMELNSLYNDKIFDGGAFGRYKSRLKEWCSRLITIDVRAYYTKCKDLLDSTLKMASMRAFNEDGELVFGISEEDEKIIHIISKIEQIFLNALVRLPVNTEELSECMRKIVNIEDFIRAIVAGDEKTLTYLANCAETSEKFSFARD